VGKFAAIEQSKRALKKSATFIRKHENFTVFYVCSHLCLVSSNDKGLILCFLKGEGLRECLFFAWHSYGGITEQQHVHEVADIRHENIYQRG
jgi:hypothetical protein